MLGQKYDLVGGFSPPLWKIWVKWKSVGMMTFPTEWKVINFMFQTTNQWLMDLFTSGVYRKIEIGMGKWWWIEQFSPPYAACAG